MDGLKLSIHPLFYAFGVYYALTGRIFLFLIYTIVALLHELGHSFAAAKAGYRLDKITLMPYGAVVSGKTEGLKPADEITIALAGPLVNVAVGTLFVAFWWIYPLGYAFTETAAAANFSLAAINLLPFFPLDGGRILLAALAAKIGKKKAEKICRATGVLFGAALAALFVATLFYTPNFSLAFFSAFVISGALCRKKENSYVKLYTHINADALKRGLPYKKQAVSAEVTLKKLVNLLDPAAVNEIVVFDGEKAVATLDEKRIAQIIERYSVYARIAETIDKTDAK